MVLNDMMSRQGSLWPQSRLGCTLWQAGKWEQESIHQGLESREQSYLIFLTASLPSALDWHWQKKMICADQSLAHRRPVVAAACLKGASDKRSPTTWLKACNVSLTFRLRDDCRWVTNTSWLRYKARILTFRFTRRTREQMSLLARMLDSNSRYGRAQGARKQALTGPLSWQDSQQVRALTSQGQPLPFPGLQLPSKNICLL